MCHIGSWINLSIEFRMTAELILSVIYLNYIFQQAE
jgi:hypothetical protein